MPDYSGMTILKFLPEMEIYELTRLSNRKSKSFDIHNNSFIFIEQLSLHALASFGNYQPCQ